jgi:hypothetical protein
MIGGIKGLMKRRLHNALLQRYGADNRIYIVGTFLIPSLGFGALTLIVEAGTERRFINVERFFGGIWIESQNWEVDEKEARFWMGQEDFPLVQPSKDAAIAIDLDGDDTEIANQVRRYLNSADGGSVRIIQSPPSHMNAKKPGVS